MNIVNTVAVDPVAKLKDSINSFVSSLLKNYAPSVSSPKAIHDAVWGTHIFTIPECVLIDTPLIQRLRGIHQTAFAFLTYPSAKHDRFNHTIGTSIVASRMAATLNEKYQLRLIQPSTIYEIKLAALLHDCGHGLFSHVSEDNYKQEEAIKLIRKQQKFSKVGLKAHEIISYLIVDSEAFKEFFSTIIKNTDDVNIKYVNPEHIANMILGLHIPEHQYLADIINGPFDADKIDYIMRDAYFTGLRFNLDVDRLLYAIEKAWVDCQEEYSDESGTIQKHTVKRQRLVCTERGVNSLEQLLFAKMQLFASLYHHHKVRASDTMLDSFVGICKTLYQDLQGPIKLVDPVDFLNFWDYDLLNDRLHKDDALKGLIEAFRTRRLFKRALVISPQTVEDESLFELTRLRDHPNLDFELNKIRDAILSRIHPRPSAHSVIIDIPNDPSLREGTQTYVLRPDKQPVTLREYFPTDDWLTAYYANKWRAHIFCPSHLQHSVNKASLEVLTSGGIKCNSLATLLALKAAN